MKNISVVISAFNEEQNIEDTLSSIKGWANEIIVIDNGSSDKTVSIAKKYTSKIFRKENNLMLNVNKNFGFTKAIGAWILSLDADERMTDELKNEISQKDDEVDGYWISRKNIIFGKWIESNMWWPDYQLRLFRKNKGWFPEKDVHEYIKVEGKTEKLIYPMIHMNYSSINQYIQKLNMIYTEDEAKRVHESGKKVGWVDAVRYPVNDFLKTFFAQKGYKDGLHGLVLSFLQAFYAEVVFAKVWEMQGFKQENSKDLLKSLYKESGKIFHEFQYWFLSSKIVESKSNLKKAVYRVIRKATTLKLKRM